MIPSLKPRLQVVEAETGKRAAYRQADHQQRIHLDLLQPLTEDTVPQCEGFDGPEVT
jgi:hypothetical protein